MLSNQEWADWKADPVTVKVFEWLDKLENNALRLWRIRSLEKPIDQIASDSLYVRGYLSVFENIRELDRDTLNEKED